MNHQRVRSHKMRQVEVLNWLIILWKSIRSFQNKLSTISSSNYVNERSWPTRTYFVIESGDAYFAEKRVAGKKLRVIPAEIVFNRKNVPRIFHRRHYDL